MTLNALLKSLEPTTLEVKAFISQIPIALTSAILLRDSDLLLLAPAALLPLYVTFRLEEYKTRNEKFTNPDQPQKVISEYLGGIRFDNWREQISQEEFEALLKRPIKEKPVEEKLDTSKIPDFYRNRILTLYSFK